MKTFSLSGSQRKTIGKKDAHALRREGKVPCVLYGGKEHLQFSAVEKDFKKLIYTPDIHLVKLDVGGKKFDAILKDIQYHPVHDNILHVDFLEVMPDKPVVMHLPLKLEGSPIGVKEGGKLLKKLNKLTAKGLISKLPDAVTLQVEHMKIGDHIRIKDIKLDGVTFLYEPNVTVVAVKIVKEIVEEVPIAAATTAAASGATPAAGAAPAVTPAAGAAPAAPAKEEKKAEKKK